MDKLLYKNKQVKIKNAKLYNRYCSKSSYKEASGSFFIFDPVIKNNRIRLTLTKDSKIESYSSGWVNVFDIIDLDSIEVGSKVIVDGKVTKMADGEGESFYLENENSYVTDILDGSDFINNIGISKSIDEDRIGFVNICNIIKYVDEEQVKATLLMEENNEIK